MNRQQMLNGLLQVDEWDIIIIGGGATGLGAAVDSASRGYKTLLVEQYDFAKGTSSRSTKLIHGGVRYLAHGNIKLVRESLKERGLLLKNAPHVCHETTFVLPSYRWWEKWYYRIGLTFYEWLSGKRSLGKTLLLSKKETKKILPAINPDKLKGAVSYYDGQFDDSRLAINLAQTAYEQGATVINYCKLQKLTKTNNSISGAVVTDMLSGNHYNVKCKVIINATGVFTDNILLLDDSTHKPVIVVSQGSHLVVDKYFFPGNSAMIIPTTDDGRVLFAVPWHNKVVIGTTDTPLTSIRIEPIPLKEEVDFIISHINRYLTKQIKHSDIRSAFSGLRPLINIKGKKHTSLLPRDHSTTVSASGLVTVTGGKWTTYRKMGKAAVDNAVFVAKLEMKTSVTASLPIHGYTTGKDAVDHLDIYGSDAGHIREIYASVPYLQERLHADLPYIKAEVVWAVRNEMAQTVEDVLARRTRALYLHASAAIESAPIVADLMAAALNLPDTWKKEQVKEFTALAKQYLID